MTLERVQPCARDAGPDAQRVVKGGGGEQRAAWGESDVVNLFLVPVEAR